MSGPDTIWELFYGYTVFWVLVAIFLVRLMREQALLKKQLEEFKFGIDECPQPDKQVDILEKQAKSL